MPAFKIDHVQLVLTGESKTNQFILETLRKDNILLLRKE